MVDPLVADWDLIHRWEWFRRARWRAGFRAAVHGLGGGLARAFADVAHEHGAEVLLDASCGLGRRAIVLAEKGLNIIGSDPSGVAIAHARELARDENSSATFLKSSWTALPKRIPHSFDGILASAMGRIPTFDELGMAFVGLFHSLRPGGFVMWAGVGPEDPIGTPRKRLLAYWEKEPRESVEWFHREGRLTCAMVKQWKPESDYIDEHRLYVSEDGDQSRLESTTIRWPGYWEWSHWQDVTRMAGFERIESRRFDGYGLDGGPLNVNIAWRGAEGDVVPLLREE